MTNRPTKIGLIAAVMLALLLGVSNPVKAQYPMQAGANSTRLQGGAGNTTLQAGTGNTTLQAGTGNTTIQAGTGSSLLQTGVEREPVPPIFFLSLTGHAVCLSPWAAILKKWMPPSKFCKTLYPVSPLI
ncbi:MAG: calcium-binding protein [Candidatus Obscuribacter sp.]|nr:calcium-binding protein [Candidatus Obscuribacter sp.]